MAPVTLQMHNKQNLSEPRTQDFRDQCYIITKDELSPSQRSLLHSLAVNSNIHTDNHGRLLSVINSARLNPNRVSFCGLKWAATADTRTHSNRCCCAACCVGEHGLVWQGKGGWVRVSACRSARVCVLCQFVCVCVCVSVIVVGSSLIR